MTRKALRHRAAKGIADEVDAVEFQRREKILERASAKVSQSGLPQWRHAQAAASIPHDVSAGATALAAAPSHVLK